MISPLQTVGRALGGVVITLYSCSLHFVQQITLPKAVACFQFMPQRPRSAASSPSSMLCLPTSAANICGASSDPIFSGSMCVQVLEFPSIFQGAFPRWCVMIVVAVVVVIVVVAVGECC